MESYQPWRRFFPGIRSRESVLYVATAFQGYIVLFYEIYCLTFNITFFHREKSENAVEAFRFFINHRLARMIMEDIIVSLFFSIIFYFCIGFRPLSSQFFILYAIVLFCQYISVMFAMLCVATFEDFYSNQSCRKPHIQISNHLQWMVYSLKKNSSFQQTNYRWFFHSNQLNSNLRSMDQTKPIFFVCGFIRVWNCWANG